MEPLKLDAFIDYRFLSGIRFAPGGARAALCVTECDREANGYRSNLWLYENGRVKRLTGMDKESAFFWEDGTHLIFAAARSEAEKKRKEAGESFTSYYRLAVDGGEALPAFELPLEAGELFPFGENRFYFLSEIERDNPDAYLETKENREKRLAEEKENADYIVLEEHPFWTNGGSYLSKPRTALFLLEDGKPRRITDERTTVGSAAALDGRLYYTAESYLERPLFRQGLYCYDPATGKTETLYEPGEWYFGELRAFGSRLLIGLSRGLTYTYEETPDLYLLEPGTMKLQLVEKADVSRYNSTGSDCRYGGGKDLCVSGDSVYHLATDRNDCVLRRVTPDGAVLTLTGAGSIDCFDVSDNGEILAVGLLEGRLQELYRITDSGAEKISSFNDDVLKDRYVAAYEKLSVESRGETIDGWVLKPFGYDPEKRYPAILDIHGGPRTVYGEVFYHEMQYWAGRGYFVFFCNPKGSDGRGDAFSDIYGEYGDMDYANVMDFTDAVLEKYPAIDKARVAVTGGSYGGFMTNWIIGHTDRFCCAATQRSIMNWASFWGTSDIGILFGEFHNQANVFDNPEKMWAHSPLAYAKNMVTPTLIIHSDADYRCPLSEGMQLFTALKERGVECRMVVFKGENHELSRSGKPLHRIRRLEEISSWIDRHTGMETAGEKES